MKKLTQGNKYFIVVLTAAAMIIGLAVSWTLAKSNRDPSLPAPESGAQWSKAVLSVSNLSCGGCIDTITKSVATLPGTGEVSVDLASATAEVLFDANRVKDPQSIAQVITESGYPAKLQRILAPEQLDRQLARAAEASKRHIATVGQLNVPRKDFEIELSHARARYEQIYGADTFSTDQGKQLLQRIESQIAQRLVDEAVKLQEVERAGYTITADKVDQALTEFVKEKNTTLDAFKSDLASYGYPYEYFKQKFENRIRLQNYLEEIILADSLDPEDRQQRYGNWLSNARTLAKVVYYDKNIEAQVRAGSGGGCGGGGSSSCSVGR